MAAPSDQELPYRKIGEYEITARIGVGGMGVVYEGRQPLIGKRVAVKVLMPAFSSDQELVDRFTAEARAVNEIRHRGIVDIFSFGVLPDGSHYFVMEYLEGEPFDRMIKRRGPMPVADVLSWIDEVLDALDAAHAAGIIHRDIKPSNLFLVNPGRGRSYVKLLDFGIAKLGVSSNAETPQTRASVILGTPDYISPEQARGQPISSRTDLYAIGVVLFELLTGERPFQGENSLATMWMHVDDHAPRPSDLRPDLPAQLDELILWAMEKDPSKRPQSAEDMRAHVQSIRATLLPATGGLTPPPPSRDALPARPLPSPVQKSEPGRQLRTPNPNAVSPTGLRKPPSQVTIPAPEPKRLSSETRISPLPPDDGPYTTLDRPAEPVAVSGQKLAKIPKMFGDTAPGEGAPEPESVSEVPGRRQVALGDGSVENTGGYEVTSGDDAPQSGNAALIAAVVVLLVLVAVAGVLLVQELRPKTAEFDPAPVPLSTVKQPEAVPPTPAPSVPAGPTTPPVLVPSGQTTTVKPAASPVTVKPVERAAVDKPAPAPKAVERPPKPSLTREQLESRLSKIEKRLEAHEAQTGEPDRVARLFVAQTKKLIAEAQTEGERRDAARSLDDLAAQLNR